MTAELTAVLMMEEFLQTSPLTKAETPIIRGSVPPALLNAILKFLGTSPEQAEDPLRTTQYSAWCHLGTLVPI